jgi:conjugal transfer pilus assembly protein TraW
MADVMEDAASIAQQGKALQEDVKPLDLAPWLRPKAPVIPDGIEEIQAHSQRVIDAALGRIDQQPAVRRESRRVSVFVSLSLGDAVLREIFQEASGRDDVTVVFRGVPEGNSITDGIRRIHRILKELESVPNVTIDPTKFRELHINAVPELVLFSDGAVVARAKGITGIDAFLTRANSGLSGDMGKLGPVAVVTEPDLIEVMRSKLATLDLAGRMSNAMQRYLGEVDFVRIPRATEARVREVDPTVYVRRDIKDASGQILAAAGTQINPLDKVPFRSRIIVFDAMTATERLLARRLIREARSKAILLTTRLDREAGWEGLRQLEDELRAPVFLLTEEVRRRFRIERTVSVVEARGMTFEVREVPAIEPKAN